jgi:hypothetical protein
VCVGVRSSNASRYILIHCNNPHEYFNRGLTLQTILQPSAMGTVAEGFQALVQTLLSASLDRALSDPIACSSSDIDDPKLFSDYVRISLTVAHASTTRMHPKITILAL